uniref:sensor histidine kinase n=1 Tax=Acetatifactor sp. TaxID=1872090 RepID=UPI004057BCA1
MSNAEQPVNTTQEKNRFGIRKWIISGICMSLIAAIIFTCFYPSFEKQAHANINNPLESIDNTNYIFRNCYVLYRDLFNKQNGTNASFLDVYLKPVEGYENVMTEGADSVTDSGMQEIINVSIFLEQYLKEVESEFSQLNAMYDYVIEDTKTGEYITNLSSKNIALEEQYFSLSFLFDEHGNVSVDGDIRGGDITQIRKNANEVIRNTLNNLVASGNHYTEFQQYLQIKMPINCRITFCISNDDWQQMADENNYEYYLPDYGYYSLTFNEYDAYRRTECGGIYMILLFAVAMGAVFVPGNFVEQPWKVQKICRPAIELLIVFGCVITACGNFVIDLVRWVQSGDGANQIDFVIPHPIANLVVYIINLIVMTVIFFGGWYIGICARELREIGVKAYVKKRWAFYQIFPYCKRKLKALYDMVSHFDVTQNAKKIILKIVLVNAVIVFIISSLWVGGFMIAVVYSVVLYIILRKYISDLQKNYGVLLEAINKIAEGELNVEIAEDLGVFEPFKPQVIRIQQGFKKAVDEEVKSQRMKSELITNVSHDLKTPLTAIITYVNLLKDEKVTEEQRKEYLDTLERKSLRLKVLIEDLFEVSRANSRNVTLNYMDVDIINLIKQVSFEMTDKLEASKLEVRMNLPQQKVLVSLDSQKTYRIYENLFGNIAKYALKGTRVYVDAILNEDTIEITLKNITAEEISVNAEELTERFVRGDVSRNTEGSGLGLAIAKSFTQLQGGSFEIQVDGDLFKVTTIWKMK